MTRKTTGPSAITVLSTSRVTSRKVGALAWVVLEELALDAETDNARRWAAETSVRELAGRLAVGKDAVAAALARLTDLGLVQCWTRRRAGRYAGCAYVLDAEACRRAGLVLITVPTEVPACPVTPCPVEPDAVVPDTAFLDLPRHSGSEPAAPLAASQADPFAQSLFDHPQTPPSSPPDPRSFSSSLSSTTSLLPTDQPDLPSPSLLPLTPSCQPDTSAPGVRQRGAGAR